MSCLIIRPHYYFIWCIETWAVLLSVHTILSFHALKHSTFLLIWTNVLVFVGIEVWFCTERTIFLQNFKHFTVCQQVCTIYVTLTSIVRLLSHCFFLLSLTCSRIRRDLNCQMCRSKAASYQVVAVLSCLFLCCYFLSMNYLLSMFFTTFII